jgi:DNA-binding NtrC family response regulator
MTMSASILVVDDEEVMRDSCQRILSPMGGEVCTAPDGSSALAAMEQDRHDIVIADLRMPGIDGMELLRKIRESWPETIVVVITGYATVESAVEAMRRGAYDFLPKPFTPDELRAIVGRALEKNELVVRNRFLSEEMQARTGMEEIIGRSKAMQPVFSLVAKVGPTDSTVLITGESGTGKELVARAIHRRSERRDKPFVVADCGALVENLFESELFGHVKGAFTGATVTKHGRFELANGGTIFFDEIGSISMSVQSKLLRAIQEREVTKVGSSQPASVDVRIIAATNSNLKDMIQKGRFRDDLYYRLSVVPMTLPPLRERREDIPALANHFLKEYGRKRRKDIAGITPEAIRVLVSYGWPGNVRELENTIERAVVLAERPVIGVEDLIYQGISTAGERRQDHKGQGHLAEVEETQIAKALETFSGNKTRASEFLGIDRKTLLRKIRKYGTGA